MPQAANVCSSLFDGALLRRIRKAAGLSLLDVARVDRVEPEIVAKWEYGETSPSPRQLAFLAKATGTPPETFLAPE